MTYTVLSLAAVVVAISCDTWILQTRLLRRRSFWLSYLILLFFQLISNGVLTGLQIVRYNPTAILGWRIAYAPIEDVGFGFALITITLAGWVWADRPAEQRAAGDHR